MRKQTLAVFGVRELGFMRRVIAATSVGCTIGMFPSRRIILRVVKEELLATCAMLRTQTLASVTGAAAAAGIEVTDVRRQTAASAGRHPMLETRANANAIRIFCNPWDLSESRVNHLEVLGGAYRRAIRTCLRAVRTASQSVKACTVNGGGRLFMHLKSPGWLFFCKKLEATPEDVAM